MNSANFDAARWDHWLLIISFVVIASLGLWLSWQWQAEQRRQRAQHKQEAQRRQKAKSSLLIWRLLGFIQPSKFQPSEIAQAATSQNQHGLTAEDLSQHVLARIETRRSTAGRSDSDRSNAARPSHARPSTPRFTRGFRQGRSGRYVRGQKRTFPTRIR